MSASSVAPIVPWGRFLVERQECEHRTLIAMLTDGWFCPRCFDVLPRADWPPPRPGTRNRIYPLPPLADVEADRLNTALCHDCHQAETRRQHAAGELRQTPVKAHDETPELFPV